MTLGKADTPSSKGKEEGGAIQETRGNKGKQAAVQWETNGDKTLGKAGTPSNQGKQERGTIREKQRQDPREG